MYKQNLSQLDAQFFGQFSRCPNAIPSMPLHFVLTFVGAGDACAVSTLPPTPPRQLSSCLLQGIWCTGKICDSEADVIF